MCFGRAVERNNMCRRLRAVECSQCLQNLGFAIADKWTDLKQTQIAVLKTELDVPRQQGALLWSYCGGNFALTSRASWRS